MNLIFILEYTRIIALQYKLILDLTYPECISSLKTIITDTLIFSKPKSHK